MYNSTCLAICLTMVSGHAGGCPSSANLYHPLRVHHASFTALVLRWLLMVDAAFVARCLQSAASKDLILCPICWAIVVARWPCLCIVARLSTTAQVLSDIHRLVGRSLTKGGLRQDVTPGTCPQALYGVPGGFGGGIDVTISGTAPPPSLPLRKVQQQEHDGRSHDNRAYGR